MARKPKPAPTRGGKPGPHRKRGQGSVFQVTPTRWRGAFTWTDPDTGISQRVYVSATDEAGVHAAWALKQRLLGRGCDDAADLASITTAEWEAARWLIADLSNLIDAQKTRIDELELQLSRLRGMPHPRRRPLQKGVREAIFNRDGYTCRYCGRKPERALLDLDHVTPVSKGGTNDPDNLVTACRPCNARKLNRTPEEAYMKLLAITVEMEQPMTIARAIDDLEARLYPAGGAD